MVRGTRILFGNEADAFVEVTSALREVCKNAGYKEVIIPALAYQEVFIKKAGPEIIKQMYAFKDKKDRDICLIPEVTAVIQQQYKEDWGNRLPKPVKVFYLARCYRYEKPQAGRYREFWQFGVENLGGSASSEEMIQLLKDCLVAIKAPEFTLNTSVKRGLDYYVEDGFEAEIATLGAQKQVAGGGRYDCGIGWAIGVDRILLAKSGQSNG
jgi:histidyl-tRNA synthetase